METLNWSSGEQRHLVCELELFVSDWEKEIRSQNSWPLWLVNAFNAASAAFESLTVESKTLGTLGERIMLEVFDRCANSASRWSLFQPPLCTAMFSTIHSPPQGPSEGFLEDAADELGFGREEGEKGANPNPNLVTSFGEGRRRDGRGEGGMLYFSAVSAFFGPFQK